MTDLSWTNVDVNELPIDLQSLYDDYKAAQKIASTKRSIFETAMCVAAQPKTPAGKALVFGYKFGKLSVAWADLKPSALKPKSAIASLFG